MNGYERLAEELLSSMDMHRHVPPEPVSGTIRGEMAALRLLGSEENGLSAGQLAAELNMSTSRIAAVLNSLEKKEMIVRTNDSKDRRRVIVCLTQKGEEYRLARRNEAKGHLVGILSYLGEEDAAAFVRISRRLLSCECKNTSCKEV